jgi:predicted nucleic acid-binding protein
MVIIDTNVVSELMKKQPNTNVLDWLGRQKTGQLYLTAMTIAEIRRGLALLSAGQQRTKLEEAFDQFLKLGFKERILSFTPSTAQIYAPIYRARIKAGLGVGELDLLIAAIASERDATVATRNTKDFEQTGVPLINPWLDSSHP